MGKLLLIVVLTPFLLGCKTHPVFNHMSIDEILAYNRGRPPAEQVICVERASLSSRIPKRECDTRYTFYEQSLINAGRINTASAGMPIF